MSPFSLGFYLGVEYLGNRAHIYIQLWYIILSSYPKWLYQFMVTVPAHTHTNTSYCQSLILIVLVGMSLCCCGSDLHLPDDL